MNMIPRGVYSLVEMRLRQRQGWLERAEATARHARERAADPYTPATDEERSGRQDPRVNPKLDAALEASAALETVKAWLRVFDWADQKFPPESPVGVVAQLIYREGLSQAETARRLGKDRQYVRLRRDKYVFHCALLAASEGLIRVKPGKEKGR